jgi:hypothetical protein
MLRPVALRKRPEGRKNPRVTIEVYDDDLALVRRVKAAAALAGVSVRDLTLEAWRLWLEQRERDDADLPPSA